MTHIVLSTLLVFYSYNLYYSPMSTYYYYPYLTDEETESQKGSVTRPSSHGQYVAKARF